MGRWGRNAPRGWPALAMSLALVLAGCTSSPPPQAAAGTVTLPSPPDAQVEIGSTAPGFDGGASLYAFTSSLPPDATLAAYAARLATRGFVAIGTARGWHLYEGTSLIVAVTVSGDGPPTDLLVRVATAQSGILYPDPPGTDLGASGHGGTSASTGGSQATATPDAPSPSPPDQAKASPGPGGQGQPSPAGQAKASPGPSGQGQPSPTGQAKPPPPHGGGPSGTTAP
jgi:hypothetical protein